MKKASSFKFLIDILFYGLCIGILAIVFIAPAGLATIGMESNNVDKWNLLSWCILLFSLSAYLVLIIGVYYLRKTAKYILSKNYLNEKIPFFLKKSGKFLIISSILSFCMFGGIYIGQIIAKNQVKVIMDNNLFLQLFILIVGLFFIMQSEVINTNITLKKETDLTI